MELFLKLREISPCSENLAGACHRDITVVFTSECGSTCFATTRMDPTNKTYDDDVLQTWFIFNLHTKVSFVFARQTDT
jgi:hypothetical protein